MKYNFKTPKDEQIHYLNLRIESLTIKLKQLKNERKN
tara:strand:+ start:2737 stop:2847 length:111 start_codon:yes stop_codon:yes gene_type:complete